MTQQVVDPPEADISWKSSHGCGGISVISFLQKHLRHLAYWVFTYALMLYFQATPIELD